LDVEIDIGIESDFDPADPVVVPVTIVHFSLDQLQVTRGRVICARED
jgi:hypothetical protein